MDKIDREILKTLQKEGNVSKAELGRRIGMAPSAVQERIRKLEERGVICGYHARLDPKKIDCGLLAFVFVQSKDSCWEGETPRKLSDAPEVLECHSITGEDCYLVKVRARDAEHLNRVLRDRIGVIETVVSTKTTIVLETTKESALLPITEVSREG